MKNNYISIKLPKELAVRIQKIGGYRSVSDFVLYATRKQLELEEEDNKYKCNKCKFIGMNELHLRHHKMMMGHIIEED